MKNVLISNLDHNGLGVCRISGKVAFIKNAYINEKVNVKITKENSKYLKGEVVDFITVSPYRVKPSCPYFLSCGGCDIMHIKYDKQLLFKKNKVCEIMDKFFGFPVKINDVSKSYDNLFYRNKVTFHVNKVVGFYGFNSNCIINIDKCYIADFRINEVLKIILTLNLDKVTSITIRCSKNTSDLMVIFKGSVPDFEPLKGIVSSIYFYQKTYKLVYGNSHIIDIIGDFKFYISPDSFFQINTSLAELLYKKVLEYCNLSGNERVLDLYCGTGTIGIFLANHCSSVLGIEINESAICDANLNKKINNINNINFVCGDSSDFLSFKPDVVVVDPTRNGLSKSVMDNLIASKVKRIVYTSCNPVTLARDLKYLNSCYSTIEITPFDMFPNTKHVECVCVLKLR